MAQNSSASGKAQLDALVALISTSVADVAAAYESASVPLPSLDPVVLDNAEVGKQLDDGTEKNVARAVRVIEAACAQLIATLARPGRYVLNVCYGLTEPAKCTVDRFPKFDPWHITEGICSAFSGFSYMYGLGLPLHSTQYEESACLQVALSSRVADHLRNAKAGAAGVHIDKLGLATGIPAPKLARALRILATDHIFCEGWLWC